MNYQTLHLIDNSLDQAAGVLADTAKLAHDSSVLVSVGVIANMQDKDNGLD